MDFPDAIERILGKSWNRFYSISSFLLLFLAGVVYFILSANMFYPASVFFLNQITGKEYPSLN